MATPDLADLKQVHRTTGAAGRYAAVADLFDVVAP